MNAQNICRYECILSFVTIQYIYIYYTKLKFIKTYGHNHRPHIALSAFQRNVNKPTETVLIHNCIKLTVAHTVLL